MSQEGRSSSREAIESGLRNLGSLLKARGLPGKARLNRPQDPLTYTAAAAPPAPGSPAQQASPAPRGDAASASGAPALPQDGAGQAAAVSAAGGPPPPPGGEQLEASIEQLSLQGQAHAGAEAGSSAGAASGAGGADGGAGVSSSRTSSSIRVAKFHKVLGEPLIDLDALRELSWSGIPAELRPVCWRLLLGYLPPNRSRQASVLGRKRAEYRGMVPQYYDVSDDTRSEEEIGALRQVAVDVPRTAPSVAFFHSPAIQKSLERMLYIWGIRHPASGYVQGMNDLVTPFLAVFLSEALPGPLEGWSADGLGEGVLLDVEADCYWCLSKLLEGIQDHYTYAQPGIQRTVFRVKELVAKNNGAIVSHLEAEGVDFLQFAFRWVNCLLIREVPFAAATRLWDTYLAEGGRFADFLVYVCAAFLACWQRDILGREFQEVMLFLQRLPTRDWGEAQVESILSNAYVLRNTWGSAQSHLSLA
ncbi:gyp1 [Scenedesmus sp. PABB004]|nr:gyp1 [Scenedesmus sp. PABB004]